MDKKGDKLGTVHPSRQKKRSFKGNRYTFEQETSFASTSAQKLRRTEDKEIKIDQSHEYRILQFATVFSLISELVICKNCQKDVQFRAVSPRGLGFKIAVQCNCDNVQYINSCPLIKNAFEINRRIVFVMRLLGIGIEGLKLFCGLMDLVSEFYSNTYYSCLENIHTASEAVYELFTKSALKQEKESTLQNEHSDQYLTVSGDGSWKKRGFSSLYGIVTLIGKYSNKVIDLIVKSSYCKTCETWETKLDDEEEYKKWKENHMENCSVNHEGSSGKMEVDGVKEMFGRSIEKYGVMYTRYIGDGDTKTFKGIIDINPYNVPVKKLECVLHVKKRMGSRLRSEKKKHKGIGGKGSGKLTDKLINDLTAYYGLAITRHTDSVEDMKNAIWATYFHKCSTDKNPQHKYCPAGLTSWCSYRRAEAEGTLAEYKHDSPLSDKVQEVIKPIYEDLSKDELLERCLGGNTQNDNESFNGLLWHFAPKHLYCGLKTIEIAAYLAVIIFNEGYFSILKTLEVMGIVIGPIAQSFAEKRDDTRVRIAEKRHTAASKEARIARRNANSIANKFYEEEEGVLYGPGIAD